MNEDEISFIAFHIGSFFETSTENKNKLTAIYVYMEYYDMYRLNLEKLQKTFHDTVDIRYALSIQDFEKAELVYDLIISELPLPSTKTYIQISPFISEEEIQKIQKHIQQYMSRKKEVEFEKLIQEFSNEELFFRNMKQESKTALLKDFTQQVISLGYADQSFISDVLTREKLSSTSFHNGVAIPHALHPNARKSFIAFLLLDSPILWDQDEVSIVILIGISYDQRKSFRQIFNHLVELLSRPAVVQKLASITEYKELLHTITAVDV
ncbi:PTS sugar transporter subunit IIA [[Clostridium] innocuum]|nr:PTS sugar transporter subunit IIA [[Clostridium] innocuum]